MLAERSFPLDLSVCSPENQAMYSASLALPYAPPSKRVRAAGLDVTATCPTGYNAKKTPGPFPGPRSSGPWTSAEASSMIGGDGQQKAGVLLAESMGRCWLGFLGRLPQSDRSGTLSRTPGVRPTMALVIPLLVFCVLTATCFWLHFCAGDEVPWLVRRTGTILFYPSLLGVLIMLVALATRGC